MPNRILKESICTSDSIDQLTAFEETVFYRLIVNCDDYGRFDGRPKIIASKLFPLKDIRASQIESALRALTSAELVTLYTVGGKPFLQMKTWDRHQQIRAKKSKYPAITDSETAIDGTCNHLIADDSICPRNPIQSESNPNPNPKQTAPAPETDRRFDKFWSVYPRHEGKQAAQRAFAKLNADDALLEVMITAIIRQKQTEQWNDPKYIPHPATWLNGKRWEDEPVKPGPGKRVSAQMYDQREYNEQENERVFGVRDLFEMPEAEFRAKYGGAAS